MRVVINIFQTLSAFPVVALGILIVIGECLWADYQGIWPLGIFPSALNRICRAELKDRLKDDVNIISSKETTWHMSILEYQSLLQKQMGQGHLERWAADQLRLLDINSQLYPKRDVTHSTVAFDYTLKNGADPEVLHSLCEYYSVTGSITYSATDADDLLLDGMNRVAYRERK